MMSIMSGNHLDGESGGGQAKLVAPRAVIDLKTRPRSLKTSEKVARDLVTQIVGEDIPEGTILPTEKIMAESLGVGRTTMREALRLLETQGVLTMRPGPGGGPIVRRPRPNDLGDALTLFLQFEGATYEDVMAARTYVEPLVARAAATHMGADVIDELRRVNEDYASTSEDVGAKTSPNRRFHSVIADNCGNVLLRIFAESLVRITHRGPVGVSYSPERLEASVRSHDEIIAALASRDPVAAEAAMRAHVEEATAFWRRQYGDLVAQPVQWEA